MLRQHTVLTPHPVGECHFYSAEIADELVLFDTGPPTGGAWKTLSREVDLARLKHVFITHFHVDHCGQVARIQRETRATVYLSKLDVLKIRFQDKRLRKLAIELDKMGFDEDFRQLLYAQDASTGLFVDAPCEYQILEDSPVPAQLGVDYLRCAGHTQSDLIFLVGEEAVCGDILLPDIFQTPLLEIDLNSFEGRFNNYSAYCESLAKFKHLHDYRILPGHRRRVENLGAVVRFYVEKLRERAAMLRNIPGSKSVKEITETLCGDFHDNPVVAYLKASEVVFMQDYLMRPQLIEDAFRSFLVE